MTTSLFDSEAEVPWWRDGLYFSCTGCGSCCKGEPGTVSLTETETEVIAKTLGLSVPDFQERYMWRKYGKLSLKERADYDCIFLDKETDRCAIYEVRPFQCSSFPFWPEVLKSRSMWDRYAVHCPGMNQGKYYDCSHIKRYLAT